ncbi:Cytochrome c nitrite reductase, small subunit NrfH [Marinobacterium lacunae]|uniref:Cytochrome c-type protein n=1 Tax=Marinobacterium lacunae TaxID=1232683 RepID=A0A081G1Z6_9GAMM|nr:NapC/NirT family cytochrome c [Marinobacterium lacunae]KEA64801.1 Cytochrome c nitrite reductase, small subunit NrfH [Marinobacterium lacunae]
MKRTLKLILVVAVLGVGSLLAWAATDTALHITSDAQFCGSCHSMKPMQASFLQSSHGGLSSTGTRALCTDCHLPQDSYVDYLYMKARNGAWDVMKEFVLGADDVDWHAKRALAHEFVYESGCLKCHNDLQRGSERSSKQFVAHKPYFLGTVKDTCITCHKVGHADLTAALNQHFGAQPNASNNK